MIAGGWLVALGSALAFAPVPPTVPSAPPKGPPPQMLWISDADPDKGIIKTLVTVMVPVVRTVERTVNVNGTIQKQVVNVTEYVTEFREEVRPLGEFEARTVEGKKLEGDRLAASLKGKAVLVVLDEKGIDPAYLPLFAKDTIVLTIKSKK
jgi:hypothetical protein